MSFRREYDSAELDELPPAPRNDVQRFLTAVASIKLDADGVPCDPDQALEINSMSGMAHRLVHVLRSPAGTPVGSVRKLADEFGCLLAAFPNHKGDEETRRIMGRRWLAARAHAADLLGPATASEPVPDSPSGVDSVSPLRRDSDGRLWGQLDPDDEEWSDEQVDALPVCEDCGEPMVPGVEHSGCRRRVV